MRLKRNLLLFVFAAALSAASFHCVLADGVVILKDSDDPSADDTAQKPVESQKVLDLCKESFAQMRAKNLQEAFRIAAKAKTESPNGPEVTRTYAYLYLENNQPKAAIKAMDELAKATKLTVDDLLLLGSAKWRDGNLNGANTSYKAATTLDPQSAQAETDYIMSVLALKDWAGAAAECDRVLPKFNFEPMRTTLLKLKARAEAGSDQTQEKLVPVNPRHVPGGG
jgi:thioredoxin-like negative regulator of GroEL